MRERHRPASSPFLLLEEGVGRALRAAGADGVARPPRARTPLALEIDRRLSWWLLEEGVVLERGDTGAARGTYAAGPPPRIRLRADIPRGDACTKTLLHEAAHHVGGHDGRVAGALAEAIAEGAAYVVLRRYGIDTGAYSFPYIAGHGADRALLRAALPEIARVSAVLIAAIATTAVP
jgi:hypothetical protein